MDFQEWVLRCAVFHRVSGFRIYAVCVCLSYWIRMRWALTCRLRGRRHNGTISVWLAGLLLYGRIRITRTNGALNIDRLSSATTVAASPVRNATLERETNTNVKMLRMRDAGPNANMKSDFCWQFVLAESSQQHSSSSLLSHFFLEFPSHSPYFLFSFFFRFHFLFVLCSVTLVEFQMDHIHSVIVPDPNFNQYNGTREAYFSHIYIFFSLVGFFTSSFSMWRVFENKRMSFRFNTWMKSEMVFWLFISSLNAWQKPISIILYTMLDMRTNVRSGESEKKQHYRAK